MAAIPSTTPTPRRLLIVDDHPDLASTLARSIAQACPGLDVRASRSGREALEQAGEQAVDLLVTDLMMPEMNGLELIQRLAARPAGAPQFIVLITAYDTASFQEAAGRLKVNETILKPFPPGLLIRTVRQALEEMGDTDGRARREIGDAHESTALI